MLFAKYNENQKIRQGTSFYPKSVTPEKYIKKTSAKSLKAHYFELLKEHKSRLQHQIFHKPIV